MWTPWEPERPVASRQPLHVLCCRTECSDTVLSPLPACVSFRFPARFRIASRLRPIALVQFTVLFCLGCAVGAGEGQAQTTALAAQVDSLLQLHHEDGRFHGAAAVGTRDDLLYAAGFGAADRARGRPNTADTRFLIGSLTKQFTAALVLRLVQEDRMALDGTVATYLPTYAGPGARQITIHHLLAHRSGLPSFADVRAAARGEPGAVGALDFAPGTQYAYSNAGYVLLGLLTEAVTGQPYDQAIREHVLVPAGVADDIGYAHSGHATAGLAAGYVDTWWGWGPHPADEVDPNGPFSAGMLYATPRALLQWTRAVHNGRVLPDSLVRKMITPYSDTGYGYGLIVEDTVVRGQSAVVMHHGGGINGFTAALRHLRIDDGSAYTIAVLDNTQSDATVQTATELQAIIAGTQGP